jgi:hypothetical protein
VSCFLTSPPSRTGMMADGVSRNSVENSLKSKDKELSEDVNQLTKKSRVSPDTPAVYWD